MAYQFEQLNYTGLRRLKVTMSFVVIFIFSVTGDLQGQSQFIGGVPGSIDNPILRCGSYHFVVTPTKLFRTNQEHTAWEDMGRAPDGKTMLGIHAYKDTLFISTFDGHIYRSEDFGQTLVPVATIDQNSVTEHRYFQQSDSIIYFLSDENFYVSYNGGKFFTRKLSLVSDPSAYLGNHGIHLSFPGRVFRSENHFRNFTSHYMKEIETRTPISVEATQDLFFIGLANSIYHLRSADYGVTWDSLVIDTSVTFLYDFFVSGDSLFAGTDEGLWVTLDLGNTWTHIQYDDKGGWQGGKPHTKDISVMGDTKYAVINQSEILRSFDIGDNWGEFIVGMNGSYPSCLKSDGTHLCTGTRDGTYTWTEQDPQWRLRRNKAIEDYLASSTGSTQWLIKSNSHFAYGWNGLQQSLDDGETWTSRHSAVTRVHSLIEYRDTLWYGTSLDEIYFSPDDGHSWVLYKKFPMHGVIYGLNRYGGTLSFVEYDAGDSKVYSISKPGGPVSVEFSGNLFCQEMAGGDSIVMVAGYFKGVPISINGGEDWELSMIPGMTNKRVNSVAYHNGLILASGPDGIWARSVTNPDWIRVEPERFINKYISKLAVHHGKVYAAQDADGMYVLDLETTACLLDFENNDCSKVEGSVFSKIIPDCFPDTTSIPFPHALVRILPGPIYTIPGDDGNFIAGLPVGDYSIDMIDESLLYHDRICPDTGYQFSIKPDSLVVDSLYFQINIIPGINDLHITLIPKGPFRIGSEVRSIIHCTNLGTTAIAPEVILELHDLLSYKTSSVPPTQISPSMLRWLPDTLYPAQTFTTEVNFEFALEATLFDTVCLKAIGLPIGNDTTPVNNVDTMCQVVTGSFDPNDKLVSPEGIGLSGSIPLTTNSFVYTIRFQNTGNDTAFSVTILDTLDPAFNLESFHLIYSDPKRADIIIKERILELKFPGIQLPDSATNFWGSQGMVQFSLDLNELLHEGQELRNSASIIFDNNVPVITNTVINTAETLTNVFHSEPLPPSLLRIYPSPNSGKFTVKLNSPYVGDEIRIYSGIGRLVHRERVFKLDMSMTFDLPDTIDSGLYHLVYVANGILTGYAKVPLIR